MSTMSPSDLNNLTGVTDPESLVQDNFEILNDSFAFKHAPHSESVVGPPTTGAHVLNERWIDSLGAVFICTVAATPGTWLQIQPAIVANASKPVSPITGYQVLISDANWRKEWWSGTAWIGDLELPSGGVIKIGGKNYFQEDMLYVYNQTTGKRIPCQLAGDGDELHFVFGAPVD